MNDLMHDNCNQQVKENCREILDTSGIIGDILDLSSLNLHGHRDIVMKRDKDKCGMWAMASLHSS